MKRYSRIITIWFSRISVLLLCLLFAGKAAGQDTSSVKNNQFYLEGFGNDFPGLPLSVNYSRKIIKEKISLQPFLGIGFPNLRRSKFMPGYPDGSLNAGVLIRGRYKTNALWGSISGNLAYGYWDSNKALYNFSLELGAAYQLQWSKEKFFSRFSLGMKMSSDFIAGHWSEAYLFYPSAGICIGRGANFYKEKKVAHSIKPSPLTHNVLYVEFLGSIYAGRPEISLFNGNILSLNYCRKLRNIMLFAGIGLPRKRAASWRIEAYTLYAFDAGVLFRIGYKRNTFWASFSGSISNYKRYYTKEVYHIYGPGGGTFGAKYIYHDVDFDLTPGICYQAQSRDEHFCFRLTAGVKLFSPFLLDSYEDRASSNAYLYPWLGISVGGGW